MEYVQIDPLTGVINWDVYFEYLRDARLQFPQDLHHYATNREHYSADGRNSLQGSWLLGVQLGFRAQEVVLSLLSAWQDRKHVLTYVGVKSYSLSMEVNYIAGDRDVLAHEFRVEKLLIVHEIMFRTGKTICITCKDVLPTAEILS